MRKTATYYKKNPEARKKKASYDTRYNKRPEQRSKRSELVQYNRARGTYGNGDKLDASHRKGKIVGFEPESTNRARIESMIDEVLLEGRDPVRVVRDKLRTVAKKYKTAKKALKWCRRLGKIGVLS